MGVQKLVSYPKHFDLDKDWFGFNENFSAMTPGAATVPVLTLGDDAPTIAAAPGHNLSCAAGATNNNYSSIRSSRASFKLTEGKKIHFNLRATLSEAVSSGAVNFAAGLTDQSANDTTIGDDGAVPEASGAWEGALFYGKDGSTSLFCAAADSTGTIQDVELVASNRNNLSGQSYLLSDASAREFRIDVVPNGPSKLDACFSIDGVPVAQIPLSTASASALYAMAGVKTGGAQAQTLTIQKIMCVQAR